MNGKKVLDHLIRLFVVLNIILWIFNHVSQSNEYSVSEERMEQITQLLEKKGITIKEELARDFSPKSTADLQYIGEDIAIREEIVKSFFDNKLASVKRLRQESVTNPGEEMRLYVLDNETLIFDKYALRYENLAHEGEGTRPSVEQAKKMCAQLLKRISYGQKELEYEIEVVEKAHYITLTYFPKLEGIPVVDAYRSFDVYEKGIARGTLYLGNIEVTSEKGKEIYPIDLMLFGIEDILLERGVTEITDITLVYKRSKSEDSIWGQQIIPMYKIEAKGLEEALFVNAYSNELMD